MLSQKTYSVPHHMHTTYTPFLKLKISKGRNHALPRSPRIRGRGGIDSPREDSLFGSRPERCPNNPSNLFLINFCNILGLRSNFPSTRFLSGRSMSAVVNGYCSSFKPINRGVPQDSVLSPTLSLFFINDLSTRVSYPLIC